MDKIPLTPGPIRLAESMMKQHAIAQGSTAALYLRQAAEYARLLEPSTQSAAAIARAEAYAGAATSIDAVFEALDLKLASVDTLARVGMLRPPPPEPGPTEAPPAPDVVYLVVDGADGLAHAFRPGAIWSECGQICIQDRAARPALAVDTKAHPYRGDDKVSGVRDDPCDACVRAASAPDPVQAPPADPAELDG